MDVCSSASGTSLDAASLEGRRDVPGECAGDFEDTRRSKNKQRRGDTSEGFFSLFHDTASGISKKEKETKRENKRKRIIMPLTTMIIIARVITGMAGKVTQTLKPS